MTPAAVIHRYLELCSANVVDREALAHVIGADAGLAGRWLTLLGCDVAQEALGSALTELDEAALRHIGEAQAWALTAGADSVKLDLATWRTALQAADVAQALAGDGHDLRLRALLGLSGIAVAHDAKLIELMRFRGTAPALLEDADAVQKAFCVAGHLHLHGEARAAGVAADLLAMDARTFATVCRAAEEAARRRIASLALVTDPTVDWSARLWLRQEMRLLATLLAEAPTADTLAEAHRITALSLFGYVPTLLLVDPAGRSLSGGDELTISLDSRTSAIARALREGVALRVVDRPESAVADRQALARMAVAEGIAVPLGRPEPVGVMVFAAAGATPGETHAEDTDRHEYARALYAEEIANHWARSRHRNARAVDLLARYREVEHKRLREVVHEANNPLTVVRNYVHILEMRLAHEPSALEQLQLIDDELGRAADILQTAKDMSEPAELGVEVVGKFSEVELNSNLRRALQLHRAYADERYVNLVGRLADGELKIRTVESKLQQILANLLRNAIEACRRGDQITVESAGGVYRHGSAGIEFTVRDTGPGMAPDVLARLFEPKRSTKGPEHSGLGLSIVGRLVRELGGALDVRTSPASGTSFVVFLPL